MIATTTSWWLFSNSQGCKGQPSFFDGIAKLDHCWSKCVDVQGYHVKTSQVVKSHRRPQKYFQRGQNQQHFKKLIRFRRGVHIMDHFSARRRRKRFFCVLTTFQIEYLWGGPRVRAKILRYFVGRHFFQIPVQGRKVPPCHPAGAHVKSCGAIVTTRG